VRTALAAAPVEDQIAPSCSSVLRQAEAHQAQSTGVDRDLVCSLPEGHEGRHIAPASEREPETTVQQVFAWDARGYVVRAATQRF
jgi:hypothetical protein